jgi:hypothetical protein
MRILAIYAVVAGLWLGTMTCPAWGSEIPLDKVLITLERSPCVGACQAYRVTIYGTGGVHFDGQQNVACMGASSWQIAPGAVVVLVNKFLAAHFFQAADKYGGRDRVRPGPGGGLEPYTEVVSDGSGIKLTLQLGGRANSVWLYDHAPAELMGLAESVDEVAQTTKCVRGEGG